MASFKKRYFPRDFFVQTGRIGGRRGGKKGGPARMAMLTAKERSALARKAARARWKKKAAGKAK